MSGRPRANEAAVPVYGGYMYRGTFYSHGEWGARERRREQWRASKGRSIGYDMVISVAALYAFGLEPKQICARMGVSDSSVNHSLIVLKDYWSAETWRDAALLEWQAATGEYVAA